MRYYLIDAFTEQAFGGNPAVIVPLDDDDSWPDDAWMQALAMEFNLSETAFFAPEGDDWRLRWFTPSQEVDLCGHATLAAAHVALHELGLAEQRITFATRSGQLHVESADDELCMDFPALTTEPAPDKLGVLAKMLGARPTQLHVGANYLAVFDTRAEVAAIDPDLRALSTLEEGRGCIVTAPGDADAPGQPYDFVSRYFVPSAGVDEDPVTGSAHCLLAPYWAQTLGKNTLRARQISQRGGTVGCEVVGDRIKLSGQAVTVATGSLRAAALGL